MALLLVALGNTVHQLGDDDEAVRLLERALVIQSEVLGEDHPDVAQTLTNLATVQLGRGATAEALVLLERVLA